MYQIEMEVLVQLILSCKILKCHLYSYIGIIEDLIGIASWSILIDLKCENVYYIGNFANPSFSGFGTYQIQISQSNLNVW